MKRLGFFVVLCLVISLFSPTPSIPFLSPQKAYAQTSSEQAVIDAAIDIRIRSTTSSWPANLPANLRPAAERQYEQARQFALAINAGTTAINAVPTTPTNLRNQVTLLRAAISGNLAAAGGVNTVSNEIDPLVLSALTNSTIGATAGVQANGATRAGQCSLVPGVFDLYICINELITWLIKNTILQIAGFLLWLTANMLNYAVQVGILEFRNWAPDTLYPIWLIIRQITSLFVLFAGLWIGFWYIIGGGDKFKRYIPWIIMFGLFVNFSYPLTRGLIDISNVLSLNIYASTVGTAPLTVSAGGDSPANPGSIIIGRMGLQGLIFSATQVNDNATSPARDILSQVNTIPGALMAVVFVGYSAWIFFLATALLVARTAVLVFLIVASPLLFVDSVIPKLGDEAVKLRKLFFSQLVVAPVFMIMLALTLKFLEVFGGTLGSTGGGVVTGGANTIQQFFNILMMLIMLQITLKVTKSVSGSVGEFATKTIGQVGGFAAGAATMGTGLIARQTIGRAAGAARDSSWVRNNQNSFIGRRVYDLSNSVASSTFDLRNNAYVKSKTDKIGLTMGMGSKLNYQQTVENRTKDRIQRYGRIQTSYKKDEYDDTGKLIHRAGDINQDGLKAAAKFRESQGRSVSGVGLTGAVKRADRFIFNKKPLWDEFEKNNEKLNAEDKQAVEKEIANLTKEYATSAETGRATTIDAKKRYLDDLENQINQTKEIDPELRGVHGQALVKSYKDLTEKYLEDLRANDEKEKTLLGSYTSTDGVGRAKMTRDAKDDKQLEQKMNTVGEYLSVDNSMVGARNKKVEALLKLNNSDSAKAVINNDTFADLQETYKKDIEKEEATLLTMARFTADDKKAYDEKRTEIEKKKRDFNEKIMNEKKALLDEYNERSKNTTGVDTSNYVPQPVVWAGQGNVEGQTAQQRKSQAQSRIDQFYNPDVDITNPNQQQTQQGSGGRRTQPQFTNQQQPEPTLETPTQATTRTNGGFTLETKSQASNRLEAQQITSTFDAQKVDFVRAALQKSSTGSQDRSYLGAASSSAENDGVYNQNPGTPTRTTDQTNPPKTPVDIEL